MSDKKVLIIEDEENIRSLIKDFLGLYKGIDVILSSLGAEAIEEIQDKEVDLTIIDITLPDVNGMDLFEAMQRRKPDFTEHVIFMSGYEPDAKMLDFFDEIECQFLQKPFHLSEFREVVNNMWPSKAF